MSVALYNFPAINQGETWDPILTLTEDGSPVDLTDATARLTIRTLPGLTAPILADGDLTDADGLTLGDAAGSVTILRSATQTAAWLPGAYHYELKVTFADGKTRALLQGLISIQIATAEEP
jgi:hypothetical protein